MCFSQPKAQTPQAVGAAPAPAAAGADALALGVTNDAAAIRARGGVGRQALRISPSATQAATGLPVAAPNSTVA